MSSPGETPRIAGLVLAGGEGRRMGGADKGLLSWRGRPMAAWVVDALDQVVSPVMISANRSLTDYRRLLTSAGCVRPDDDAVCGQGPLAGLLSGLRQAQTLGADAVLVCPCDTPQVTPAVLARLLTAWQAAPGAPVIAECDGRVHPLHGVYPVSLVPLLESRLQQGDRKVRVFTEAAGATTVDCSNAREAFINCNDPGDMPDR